MSEQALTKIEPMPIESMDRHAGPLDMEPAAFRAGLDRRKENRKALMDWIRAALVENVDYGRIDTKRGKSKPSLFKPGAEKICGMLGIISTFPTLNEYEQCALKGIEIKSVVLRCALLDSRGVNVAEGVGARSLAQDYGDLNKALKMAEKSAHIDATLRMAGLSEVFTQDLEDMPPRANIEPERSSRGTNVPQRPATQSTAKPPSAGVAAPAASNARATAPATEEQRIRWIQELKRRGEWALGYCYDKGWLLPPTGKDDDWTPGEPLECLGLERVPVMASQAKAILAELDSLLPEGYKLPQPESDDGDLGPQKTKPAPKGEPDHHKAPWYNFPMPWGKNAGKILGKLPKNYLFGLWANWQVETEYNGKPKSKQAIETDREFRAMLDAAGVFYEFRDEKAGDEWQPPGESDDMPPF